MDLNPTDEQHLRRAVELAVFAVRDGEFPYGSVLVDADNQVIAQEHNTTRSSGDITAHPELKLARWAASNLSPQQRETTTMFTSCQPCPMCTNVIARAGLGRVVFALSNAQLHDLQPDDLPRPDSFRVAYHGPHLFGSAAEPIRAFYRSTSA